MNKIKRKKNSNSMELLLSLSFFLTMGISVWGVRTPNATVGSDFLRIVLRWIMYVLLIIEFCFTIFSLNKRRFIINKIFLWLSLYPIFYWTYIHVWFFDMESLGITTPLITLLFALQSDNVKKRVFMLYKKLIILVSIIGIISYCSYVFNLSLPYTIEPYYDGRSGQNYVNYYNVSFLYINSLNTRLCGIFNEPGWFGTTIALLLCYEKFCYKKITDWILVIAGTLTYSLAFFIIILLGFVIVNIDKIRNWLVIIVCLLAFVFILPSVETSNPQINNLISRMTITSTGLTGNNRSTKTVDNVLYDTLSSRKAMFGHGDGYAEYINGLYESKQILTIKTEIINLGVIGFSLLYIIPFFLCISICRGNKKALIFIILFWISLYQRPWLYIVSNYMLLLSTIAFLSTENIYQNNTHLLKIKSGKLFLSC